MARADLDIFQKSLTAFIPDYWTLLFVQTLTAQFNIQATLLQYENGRLIR